VLAVLSAVYLLVLVRTAWISDDAYISLRTVDNFLQGYGLTWNADERVQTFTHPLWLLFLAVFCRITGELFLTTIFMSITAAAGAFIVLLSRLSRSATTMALGGLILIFSPGFVSFSTSGLENALTFLIAALFMFVWLRHEPGPRRSFLLGIASGLMILNRLDTALLCLPVLALDVIRSPGRPLTLRMMALGLAPVAAWFAFALVYYGFFLPNPAYAKLWTGIARSDYAVQGFKYLYDALLRETIMTVTIAVMAVVCLKSKQAERRALALGVVLYLAYVVVVGGDFMRGRMLTVPLFVSVGLVLDTNVISRRDVAIRIAAPAAAVICVLGLGVSNSTVLSGRGFGDDLPPKPYLKTFGIADERAYYFQMHGWLNGRPLSEKLGHDMSALRDRQSSKTAAVKFIGTAGVLGLEVGPTTHAVDNFAIGDPLLSRLPLRQHHWRPGHFPRVIPAGYLTSLETGGNAIEDAGIHDYYEQLRLVTRGPLLAGPRWAAILKLNFGRLDDLVRGNYDYQTEAPDDLTH